MPNLGPQFVQPTLPFTDTWRLRSGDARQMAHQNVTSGDGTTDTGGTPERPNWSVDRYGAMLHASSHPFKPGDLVLPESYHKRGTNYSISSNEHAYAAMEEKSTFWEGDKLHHHVNNPVEGWGARVHEVRPLFADSSDDPNWDGNALRSNKGFEVVKEHRGERGGKVDSLAPGFRTFETNIPPMLRGYNKTMGY